MPFYDYSLASGLLCGILFGYILESAGFGSACKLTAQFRFSDWSVLKVMFTAIVVAAVGLYALSSAGVIAYRDLYVPPAHLGGAAIGGVLIGAGFAVGGYCPGTAASALGSGRWDGLIFMIGMVVGVALFAAGYDTFGAWVNLGTIQTERLPELLGISEPVLLALFALLAAAIFWFGSRVERQQGGALTAEALDAR
ncbi:DUF6691 family protein [Hydrogenophilus thiooxidans]|uniref:DUF6691 family protein n=1 Tax=Hydrogenophilus thiooxidans TaxID=2820326 RepID=UPI001C2154C6|nr:DUF6691 family protein [Hydrogenophilus thiooxidans]